MSDDDRIVCPCCGAGEDRAIDHIVVDKASSRVRGHRAVCMECGHSTGLYRTGVGALRAWSKGGSESENENENENESESERE